MQTITVNASKTYDILIGSGLLAQAGALVRKALPKVGRIMVVSDDNVFPLYGQAVADSLSASGLQVSSYVFPHGEQHKTLETYAAVLNELCSARLTRSDAVVALGGGVVGDLAGFAAATYQRGISLVQIPTTLLASVDSSVGGKTAVDLPAGKNQVGCFYQPNLVLCDTDTLSTLPDLEYRNGCAEIIKYAVLDSEEFFAEIDKTPICEMYEHVIAYCVNIKKLMVEEDEQDNGLRMLLNLGHTMGHGVEACSHFGIPHGQAVSIGMAAVTRAAAEKNYCTPELAQRTVALLQKYHLPVDLPYPAEDLAAAAKTDKKNTSGSMRLIVPYQMGDCRVISLSGEDFLGWLKAGGAK